MFSSKYFGSVTCMYPITSPLRTFGKRWPNMEGDWTRPSASYSDRPIGSVYATVYQPGCHDVIHSPIQLPIFIHPIIACQQPRGVYKTKNTRLLQAEENNTWSQTANSSYFPEADGKHLQWEIVC